MLKIEKILSAATLIGALFVASAYAAETDLAVSPEKVGGIGGYKDDHGKEFGARLGGTAGDIRSGYTGTGSCDAKATFVRIDADSIPEDAISVSLSFTGGSVQSNRNGTIRLYKAIADVNTVVVSDATAIGESWEKITWSTRPQLGEITEVCTVPAGSDISIDVTNMVLGKTGKITIAILGEKSGNDDADATYNTNVVYTLRNSEVYACRYLDHTGTYDNRNNEVSKENGSIRYLVEPQAISDLNKVVFYHGWRNGNVTINVYALSAKPDNLEDSLSEEQLIGTKTLTHPAGDWGYFYSTVELNKNIPEGAKYLIIEQAANVKIYARSIVLFRESRQITWDTDTDFGWIGNESNKLGTLRFLAAADLKGINVEDVKSVGFALTKNDEQLPIDFNQIATKLESEGINFAANTTYWVDVTDIPANTEHSNICAIPYVTTISGKTYWGEPFTEKEALDWTDSNKITGVTE